jgi:hypothetical protein
MTAGAGRSDGLAGWRPAWLQGPGPLNPPVQPGRLPWQEFRKGD